MPFVSRRQQRAMYAAASGDGKSDIPKAVAKKYIADSTSPQRKLAAKRKAKSK